MYVCMVVPSRRSTSFCSLSTCLSEYSARFSALLFLLLLFFNYVYGMNFMGIQIEI